MLETRISWLRALYLATFLATIAAQGENFCPVTYNGITISEEEQWNLGIVLPSFDDFNSPGFKVDSIEAANMTSVTIKEDDHFARYISLSYSLEESRVDIFLSDSFLEFEASETLVYNFDLFFTFVCPQSSNDLTVKFTLSYSNNHPPTFSNQNNAIGDGYLYALPMPFPRGISITTAYNPIFVFDVDIMTSGETEITFSLQDDLGMFEVSLNEEASLILPGEIKKRFYADLTATKRLELTEGLDLVIIATDNEGATQFSSAPIRIDIDAQNSDPLPGSFDSALYSAQIIVEEMQTGPVATHQPIILLEAPQGVEPELTLMNAPGQDPIPIGLFSTSYDLATGEVTLQMNRYLEGAELQRDVIVMELNAEVAANAFTAKTIIHVDVITEMVIDVLLAFDSSLYTAAIRDPPEVGIIYTATPIVFADPKPTGDVTVVLEQANSPAFIAGLFDVSYSSETGEVTLTLVRVPTNEERAMFEVLVMTLKATQNPATARTIIQVDLPPLEDPPPPVPGTFDSVLYLAEITNPEIQPGEVIPTHQDIKITDAPDGDIEVTLHKAPGESAFYADLFSVRYDEVQAKVILQIERYLSSNIMDNEVLLLQLKASQAGNPDFSGDTIIQVNVPAREEPPPPGLPGTFDSILYTATITDPEIIGPVVTHQKIIITDPPAGEIKVSIVQAPGETNYFPGLFVATYNSAANEVTVQTSRVMGPDELNNEVLVVKLIATEETTNFVGDTIIHMDLPPIAVEPPPFLSGSFASPLYMADIEDPEIQPGTVIETHETITIVDPPAGDIKTELLPAPGGAPSFESYFTAVYNEATGTVELQLNTQLSEEALANPYLIMTLRASQDGVEEFGAETLVHIMLPASEGVCTTARPFPTEEDPVCPTCEPCLPPTTETPSTIQLVDDPYITTKEAGYIGELFQVQAELLGGTTGTIQYDLTENENVEDSIMIDHQSGWVTIESQLAPGYYEFKVTAEILETGDKDTGRAIVEIRTTATCENGVTCYHYALITVEVPEATANDNILPGDANPSDPSCQYTIYKESPFVSGWFTLNPTTGALGVSADSDYEDERFNDLYPRQLILKLQVTCDPDIVLGPRRTEIMTTRQQMIVVVNLTPKNEFPPMFASTNLPVAYPTKSLAHQLLPGAITVLEATDADADDTLSYELNFVNDKFKVNRENGYLYPVDGAYNYQDQAVKVKVTDSGNLEATVDVQIHHVNKDQVAVIAVGDATLEDVDSVLAELNDQLAHIWGAISSAVIAEDPEISGIRASSALSKRMIHRARAQEGGLIMVIYALDDNSNNPKSYSQIKSLLDGLQPGGTWTVSMVQTWEDASGFKPEGGTTVTDTGLETAVIVLGVLVGLLILAIILILYITIFRRKQQEKMRAKSGFKNRTSFSKEGSSLENGKPNGLHPDRKEGSGGDEENDERRKSMVTFSDEPEVIPVESARL